jgi:hypothetical protein
MSIKFYIRLSFIHFFFSKSQTLSLFNHVVMKSVLGFNVLLETITIDSICSTCNLCKFYLSSVSPPLAINAKSIKLFHPSGSTNSVSSKIVTLYNNTMKQTTTCYIYIIFVNYCSLFTPTFHLLHFLQFVNLS